QTVFGVPQVGDQTCLWNLIEGKIKRCFRGHTTAAISPDGRQLVTASDNSATLYEIETGQAKTFFKHQDTITSVVFSKRGDRIITTSNDKTARIWDTKTGQEIARLRGHDGPVISAAFSPTTDTIVTGGRDNTVVLWDVKTGKLIYRITKHSYGVKFVKFSADGQRIVTLGGDGGISLWDSAKGAEIATVVSVGSSDYAISTPSGYYLSSRDGYRGIAFRIGNKAFPFEQFDLKWNRPDFVLQTLGVADKALIEAYKRAYQVRLRHLSGSGANSPVTAPPVIEITNKNKIPFATRRCEVPLNVKAYRGQASSTVSQGALLDHLQVWINDIPLIGKSGFSLEDKESWAGQFASEKLPKIILTPGRNKIQVAVVDKASIESMKETVYVTCETQSRKPDLYVVAIGVSNYENPRYRLQYADKDAREVFSILTSQKQRYRKTRIPGLEPILNESATREHINGLKEILLKSHPEDTVVLFFSGHGILDNNLNYYFATYDIDIANPQERGISYSDILNLLDGIPARNRVVLIDSCHAGELDKNSKPDSYTAPVKEDASSKDGAVTAKPIRITPSEQGRLGLNNSFALMQQMFINLDRGVGAHVIAAARGEDFAYEKKDLKNGTFTRALLEALENNALAETDGKNGLSISELRFYVSTRVVNMTGGRQVPVSRQENLENAGFRFF
ncbi:MAG TPA: caspase family protein, partial [Pedobacter sp.]